MVRCASVCVGRGEAESRSCWWRWCPTSGVGECCARWTSPGGRPGPPELVTDLAAAVAAREAAEHPRWVWAAAAAVYPALLRAGVRVDRCHDLELTEALLLGARRAAGASPARWPPPGPGCAARPVPPDPPPRAAAPPGHGQAALFDTLPGPPGPPASRR